MFVDRSDEQLTRTAIGAGLSADVVDGLRPDRIKPIIDAAVARFHMLQQLRAELAATRAALEERKIVDRAKAVLMKARGMDGAEAYALLRKTAMDQGKRIGEIAQQLITPAARCMAGTGMAGHGNRRAVRDAGHFLSGGDHRLHAGLRLFLPAGCGTISTWSFSTR